MTQVFWHPLAHRELLEASQFYEAASDELGEIFLNAVGDGLERLKLHPRSGPRTLREIRRYLIDRFPYAIVYRIETTGHQDSLFVLAIAHLKRRPRYWAGRA